MAWSQASEGRMASSGSATARSSETFEEFYAREFRAVVGLAYALSGSRASAEDRVHDGLQAASLRRDQDRGIEDQPFHTRSWAGRDLISRLEPWAEPLTRALATPLEWCWHPLRRGRSGSKL